MAHRLTHPRDATTLLRLLLLLQRLRLPQHDYYLTLGWSGGNFAFTNVSWRRGSNRGCGPALAAAHGSEWPRVPRDDQMTSSSNAHETLALRSTPLEQAGPDVITPLHCNRSSTALQVLLLQVVCDHSTE